MGNDNEAIVTIEGNNNTDIIGTQSGDLNVLDLLIQGDENLAQITQTGNGNWVGGDAGAFAVVGEGNSFIVAQSGNDNLVTGAQMGSSNVINVTQVGNENVATVIQNGAPR